jgi:hypothetical protein
MLKVFTTLLSGSALLVASMIAVPAWRIAFDPTVKGTDWRTAGSEPVGWAPAPRAYTPAIVQVYAARAWSWRGAFADHCWIAVKPAGASTYTRYDVTGFGIPGSSTIRLTATRTPDQEWFGARPKLLQDLRGPEAEAVIAALPAAVASYPYPRSYRAWPGPNSNTFIAHIGRQIPALRLALPGNAVGKDYIGGRIVARAPSGTGFQISLGGVLGVLAAAKEGLEVNVLGLVVGADPADLSITIPGIGRLPAKADWTNGAHQGTNGA